MTARASVPVDALACLLANDGRAAEGGYRQARHICFALLRAKLI
jgi:hypothetical protein